MMTRRTFLIGAAKTSARATVVLLLTPLAGSGCGSSSSDYGSSPSPVTSSCTGIGATSSLAAGHTHELCVPATDLSSPPANGTTYATSLTSGHSHSVTLTADQLRSLERGDSVTTTTTSVSGHTHDFAIRRA